MLPVREGPASPRTVAPCGGKGHRRPGLSGGGGMHFAGGEITARTHFAGVERAAGKLFA